MLRIRGILRQMVWLALGDRVFQELHARLWFYRLRKAERVPEKIIGDILERCVSEGDTCIDIGAHAGVWTYLLSKCVGQRGQVVAFEAFPHYAEVLKKVMGLLHLTNVEVCNLALSNEDGCTNLVVRNGQGQRLTGTIHIQGKNEFSVVETVRVKTATLDNLLARNPHLLETRFIKCDVEGAELFVFEGGRELLLQARPLIFCEIVDGYCRRYGHQDQVVFNFLAELGYTFEQISKIDYLFVPKNG